MPPIDYNGEPSWLQWIFGALAVMALIAGIYGFSRKLWPPLKKFVRTVESIDELPQAIADWKKFRIDTAQSLAAQDEKIDEMHHELNHNNGSSLKDSQVRTEKDVIGLKATVARIEKGVAGLYTRAEIDAKNKALTDELEKTRPPARKRAAKPKE